MKARTELLLYQLFWTTEMFAQPTFRNLSGSFEAWAYRQGFSRQLGELERRNILESEAAPHSSDRVFRLTEAGRLLALGGRDPEVHWARPWDGKWRMVVFDLPESQKSQRQNLRRRLRAAHFGRLQQSVWMSPDPLDSVSTKIRSLKVDARTLIFFEGKPCAGETQNDLVSRSWNFSQINQQYAQHTRHLQGFSTLKKQASREKLERWLNEERSLWMSCLSRDPLLPAVLLPREYAGRKAWNQRQKTLARFAQLAKSSPDKV